MNMVIKKTTTYKRRFSTLSLIQQILGVIIGVLFFLGLIPFAYMEVGVSLLIIITIQAIISLFRAQFGMFLFELFLLFLAILSFIPILGYLFRILGFFLSFLEVGLHRDSKIIKSVNVVSYNRRKHARSRDSSSKVYEAQYEEKDFKK